MFASFNTELSGRVIQANVEEGMSFSQGDLLATLETDALDNRIQSLQRTLEASESELNELARLHELLDQQRAMAQAKARAELAQAQQQLQQAGQRQASEIRRARAQLASAQDQLQRFQQLGHATAISQVELVEAEVRLQEAREQLVQAELPLDAEQVAVLQRAVDLVHKDFDVRHGELQSRQVVKRGEIERTRKELANLQLHREAAHIRSPIDGVIVVGRIQTGDVLESGKPILEIAPPQGHRFEALVSSRDAGLLQVGMPARIKLDAYDYQKYGSLEGTVRYISPDSKPSENQEPATQAAYLVRIDLHGDRVSRSGLVGQVKLGLDGTAEIVTGRESLLYILFKRLRQSISLG